MMVQKNISSNKPGTRRRWKKILAIVTIAATVLLLLVVISTYLYVTSDRFLKGVLLVRLGKQVGQKITVERIELHPFSRIQIQKLAAVSLKDQQPLLQIEKLDVQYNLLAILLQKKMAIRQLDLTGLQLTARRDAKGQWNFEPAERAAPEVAPAKRVPVKKPSKAKPTKLALPKLAIESIRIADANILLIDEGQKPGTPRSLAINNIVVEVKDLVAGRSGSLHLHAEPRLHEGTATDIRRGKIQLDSQISLDSTLKGMTCTGDLSITGVQGVLQGVQVKNFALSSHHDIKLEEAGVVALRALTLAFMHNDRPGGEIHITGNLNTAKQEGALTVSVKDINRNLLDLAFAHAGVQFQDTTINVNNKIEITEAGQAVRMAGTVDVRDFSLLAPAFHPQPTEPMQVTAEYDGQIDLKQQIAKLNQFNFHASQKGREFGKGSLNQPLVIALGQAELPGSAPAETRFVLRIHDLDITQFEPFLVPSPEFDLKGGVIQLDMLVTSHEQGKKIRLTGDAEVRNLKVSVAGSDLGSLDVAAKLSCSLENGETLIVKPVEIVVSQDGKRSGEVRLESTADLKRKQMDATINMKNLDLTAFRMFYADVKEVELKSALVDFQGALQAIDSQKQILAEGTLTVRNVALQLPTVPSKPEYALGLNSTYKMGFNYDTNIASVEAFTLELQERNRRVAEITLAKPVKLPLQEIAQPGAKLQVPDSKLTIQCSDLGLELFNPILVAIAGIEVAKGSFSTASELVCENNLDTIVFKGTSDIKDLSVSLPGMGLNGISANSTYDVVLAKRKTATIRSFETRLRKLNKPAGQLAVAGSVDLDTLDGKFDISLEGINERLMADFIHQYMPDVELKSATVNFVTSLELANNLQKVNSKGKLTVENIRLARKDMSQAADQAFRVVLAHDISMAGQLYDLKSLTLEIARGSLPPQRLSCKALVDLRKPAGKSNITITSKGLNLDQYLGDIIQMPGKTTTGQATRGRQPSARQTSIPSTPPREIGPIDLGDLNLEGNIDIASLVFSGFTMEDLIVHFLVDASTVTIDKCAMKMNQGEVNLTGKVQTNVPGFRYDVELEVKNLAIAPFTDAFVPPLRNMIEGTLNCQAVVQGQGLLPENLAKNLSGNVTFDVSDGRLNNVPVLDAIAGLTKILELQELQFYSAKGRFDAQNGKVTIPELDFIGKLQKLGVTGWVNFNQEIEFEVALALGAGLDKKVRDLRYIGELLTTQDGYVRLPIPIVVTGTLTKPKARFELTESLKDVGKDLLRDVLKKQLEKLME